MDLRRLEEIALNASATPRQLLYDGWLVRLSPGKAKRARSVNAFYGSTLALDDKLARCAALYRAHELPLIFRITPFVSPPELDAELATRGYVRFEDTRVMVRAIDAPVRADATVEICPLDRFVSSVSSLRGASSREVSAHLERLEALPLATQGFVVRDRGTVVSAGLVIAEPPYAGIFDVITAEAYRGRGHATRLTSTMLDWAGAAGATTAYLQVDAANAAARAVYTRAGFADVYGYWYRSAP